MDMAPPFVGGVQRTKGRERPQYPWLVLEGNTISVLPSLFSEQLKLGFSKGDFR